MQVLNQESGSQANVSQASIEKASFNKSGMNYPSVHSENRSFSPFSMRVKSPKPEVAHTVDNPLLNSSPILNGVKSDWNPTSNARATSVMSGMRSPYPKSEATTDVLDSIVASRMSQFQQVFDDKDVSQFSEKTRQLIMRSRTGMSESSSVEKIRDMVKKRIEEKRFK